jgi:hypothetical protein
MILRSFGKMNTEDAIAIGNATTAIAMPGSMPKAYRVAAAATHPQKIEDVIV